MPRDRETARAGAAFRPECVDAERIAALLDGRVKDQERRELLAEIAASEEMIDVLADTAVVLGELEREERTTARRQGESPALARSIPARRRVRLEALRTAARDKVERTSLRAVAREVGISAPGLKLFLMGASSRASTLRKLREWYFSEAATRAEDVSLDVARAAAGLLVEGFPEARRPLLLRGMLRVLTKEHERQGTHPPGWLESLCRENTGPYSPLLSARRYSPALQGKRGDE